MTPDHPHAHSDPVVGALMANHRRFLEFLLARVGNREDAEEILQDAFVRSVQKAGDIRDDESAVAWFYRLLRNAIVDHHRRRGAGARALEAYARESPGADAEPDADIERVVCACVSDLIPILKPEYADLIRRVDLGGEDIASVAGAAGITPGNARVRLHRARHALRDELVRSCRTCATHGCLDCTCSRA
jgi:RNA polymerase sigma-70 factor (ECF subfamily)